MGSGNLRIAVAPRAEPEAIALLITYQFGSFTIGDLLITNIISYTLYLFSHASLSESGFIHTFLLSTTLGIPLCH
jgi:hypothetical protein